jgi:D-serine deaminase-like pyridoxal phosphate-dependent protein
MATADQIRDHQESCRPHLLRLRMLAWGEEEPAVTAAQADQATSAIIAEVEAAVEAALAADVGGHRSPAARTFLQARLDRLTRAARELVTAARNEDTAELRRHLRRFEALTSASWTVQQAVFDPASAAGSSSKPRAWASSEAALESSSHLS